MNGHSFFYRATLPHAAMKQARLLPDAKKALYDKCVPMKARVDGLLLIAMLLEKPGLVLVNSPNPVYFNTSTPPLASTLASLSTATLTLAS
jgi:hypothetical protein